MSVYTRVEHHQLEIFLRHYTLGTLVSFQGINAGIENTNYFVTTTAGAFVLTLFEHHSFDELSYFLELMAYCAEHRIPSAHPLADTEGHYLRVLNDKPAAIVERLSGSDVEKPNLIQCYAIGDALGQLHVESPHFSYHRPNGRGPHWWNITANRVLPMMTQEDATLLQTELHFQAHYQELVLPRGVIHADLFRDNALFNGDTLCGIIDFYYACNDVLLYDLAVTVNDWCRLPDGALDEQRVQAIFEGYHENRALTSLEHEAWTVMLRAAALRFWLSRLQDFYFPRPGEITHIKNPDDFRNILQVHIKTTDNLI